VFEKVSKLRIGSIMEFDSTKSRKEAYDCGRKQGAVEELEKILDFFKEERFSIIFTDKLKNKLEERLKELKEGDLK
jgi:hypothetical protein